MAIYLGLGSNLGDRRQNLSSALAMLEPLVHVEAVSALYESPPQPPAPPPAYLNAACRVITGLSARELLQHTQSIQTRLGRTDTTHWAPRPIDIDILLWHNELFDEPGLVVPHPRIGERAFVLQPLLDLDPELVHPVTGERLDAMLQALGAYELVKVEDAGWHMV